MKRKQDGISYTIYICPECLCEDVCQIRSDLYECDKCKGLFEKHELIVKRKFVNVNKGHVLPGGLKANGYKIPKRRKK